MSELPPELRADALRARGFTANDARQVEAFALRLLNDPTPGYEHTAVRGPLNGPRRDESLPCPKCDTVHPTYMPCAGECWHCACYTSEGAACCTCGKKPE
jgi:hypothetical protein